MANFDLVLIDLDDTLTDSTPAERECFRLACEAHGIPFSDEFYNRFNEISWAVWYEYEAGLKKQADILVERFHLLFDEIGRTHDEGERFGESYAEYVKTKTPLLPHAKEVLETLSKRTVVGLATNGVSATQNRRLDVLEIRQYIPHVFISEDMAMRKPEKAYFDMAMKEAGVTDKSRVLMVGDSLSADIRGANNTGIPCVWFNPAHLSCTDDTLRIDYTIDNLQALLDIVH